RVKTSPADLEQQFRLEMQIADAMHEDYLAIQQIRNLRSQLKKISPEGKLRDVAPAIKDVEGKTSVLEGSEPAGTFFTTPEGNSLTSLNAGLTTLLGIVDSADVAPTTQAVGMFARLRQALSDQLKEWGRIQAQDVVNLNSKLRRAGAAVLDPKASAVQ